MITYSIIKKSQLEGAHRLDAEYYQPEYLAVSEKIKKSVFGANLISSLLSRAVVTGGTPKKRDCKNDGTDIKFIKTDTLREGQIVFSEADCLPLKESRKNSELKSGDVIVTIIGATHDIVGRVARVFPSDPKMNINQNVALLRPKEPSFSSYLSIFLQTKYGRDQLWQQSRQTEQVNLNCREVENVLVPLPSQSFVKEIDDLVTSSYNLIGESKKIYSQAESLLLEELGLKDFKTDDDLFSIVRLSDVESANRIDAEYFQKKYEKLISKLKNQDPKILADFVKEYSTGYTFKSENYLEQGIPLIRINNIRRGYVDLDSAVYLSDKDYSLSPKDTAKSGDIILSMSGTIGMAAVIPDDIPRCSINQRILKITPKNIDKDFFVLLVNSIVGLYQLERIGTGGVQTNISYKDIKNILIPVLPRPIQQKIADLVRQSHEARKQAKQLLEQAKLKVEQLIEKGAN